MSTPERVDEPTRAAAGCPPVLATDVSHNDVVDPVVEWPPAPPSRSPDGDGRPRRVDGAGGAAARTGDANADGTVAHLAIGRGRQLLDAAVEHLRTGLETSPDEETSAYVEGAIRDVSAACERLDAASA